MFENLLSWLLLPLGVVLGLSLARKRDGKAPPDIRADALAGLSSLARNQDEQAITALTRAVEIEPGTVELQMTLGSLFRKRGEIDRAILLHEAVLARAGLKPEEASAARYELAQDYLRAGVMDRAEALLQTLVASGVQLAPALELLLDLYEQGRDWPQAIATATRLQAVRGSSLAPRIAQYYCEIAESGRHAGDTDSAAREADKALDIDRSCTRASLLLGVMAEARADWPAAIRAYERVVEQDSRYLPEVLAPLARCYAQAGDTAGYIRFLDDTEADHPEVVAVTLARAEHLRSTDGDAQTYLAKRLAATPSWRGLLFWLDGQMPEDADAASIRAALRGKLDRQPRYVCSGCGLQPSVLFWQCPGCKQWATIAPVTDRI